MVTQFNQKDMVSFTNYFAKLIKEGKKELSPDGNYEVSHADIENWKDTQSKVQKVRAKFICNNVGKPQDGQDSVNVSMNVVTDGSVENRSFSKYTPYGDFNIGIDKDVPALELFELGREYYIDIIKAPKE